MESLRLQIRKEEVPYYRKSVERLLDRALLYVNDPELKGTNTYIVLTAPSYVEIAAVCHLAGYIHCDDVRS